MNWFHSLVKDIGQPTSVEVVDVGQEERVAIVYEDIKPYVWQDRPVHKHKSKLTERERKVLHLVAEGHTYQEIGNQLGYAESTIKKDCENIIRKMNARNLRHAVKIAFSKKHRESIEPRE